MRIDVSSADVVTVQLPFRFVKRGGRKEMVLPAGSHPNHPRIDNTLLKALARAFRWKKMLESGEFATISDLAAYEKIAPTYMTRVMRLTLPAPDIVEGIVEGRCVVGLAEMMEPSPAKWTDQKMSNKLGRS